MIRRFWLLISSLLISLMILHSAAFAQEILQDAETDALLKKALSPLVAATGLRTGDVKILIVNDPEINAFVAGGQMVFINSGTLMVADNVNQIQGVVAHELGHVTAGHVVNSTGISEASKIGLAAMILQVVLVPLSALVPVAGPLGMMLGGIGSQVAVQHYLAYTRTQEASADAAAVKFLRKSDISGRGILEFFNKIRREEHRLMSSDSDGSFASDHPMTADREMMLKGDLENLPAWNRPIDPDLQQQFLRVRAKLIGYISDPHQVLKDYPDDPHNIPDLYARAYAWHRLSYFDKSMDEVQKLLTLKPKDPYFLEIKGQILLESGHPDEALAPLREATALSQSPLIAASFGHALMATENPAHYAEAKHVLTVAVDHEEDNPLAWFVLGTIYDREGDVAHANLATAERYSLSGQTTLAMDAADMALKGLDPNTADWRRANDIAITARHALERKKK
ncbi:M48 family metalloprotease [Zymomonas mobilis]|uniref:Peptidase M48 Ste24p n=1 Tax=Zymomonas mobilis subsp. pomaceae (strain ATCC 29192 / DSM 22645 / JCM 10191 / CCUG 17912 / NBRC 13757 / NCIMB 11200 / NRRL B-4491 / Barker I) TaxID=579138 RepID=F8ESX2_ZYMMT|nr:M48 family metalloprotease [Zymomonas mobilis]AEI37876.1 peptidase M48 Ste24p [Zymomonas mobilis subsp. pomaceae ATCC 29192]MDX5949242.1 M48 family metalloprotease [Zymomonas mobilis subsp. pomaceae]